MKRISCVAVAIMLAVSGAGMAVELEPDCGYVYNETMGTPPGFDAMFFEIVPILGSLGVEFPPDWHDVDMESVLDFMDGDGIPDNYQLGMLGAVLCEAAGKEVVPADVLVQFNANVAAFDTLIVELAALFAVMGPIGADMATVGQNLVDLGLLLGPGYEMLIALGEGLIAGGADFTGFVEEYGVLTIVLPLYSNWFAGMAGLSSEMYMTIDGLLVDLLEELDGVDLVLLDAAANLQAVAPMIEGADPALAAACVALADALLAAIPLLDIDAPVFEIYGVSGGKLANEPFSASGDYNEDGLSNGDTYDAVTGAGGDRGDFVGAATGSNPFWPGNPGLPVAGALGLALLAGMCTTAGVISLRKK